MRRTLSVALAVTVTTVPAWLFGTMPPAAADTPGCVSESEYIRVHDGMSKAGVHRLFDTRGVFADGGAGGYARAYPRCGNTTGRVIVEYAATASSARVANKKWESPARGDVRVWEGGAGRNSFDLASRGVRRDHVYARGGDDYVFMRADGYRDIVRCGAGKDLVQVLGGRETGDRYLSCERVERYSP